MPIKESLDCEKKVQPPKYNLTYKESVNENAAKSIRILFALDFGKLLKKTISYTVVVF